MKTCTACGSELPLSAFSKRAMSPDGLQPTCKSCVKSYRKDYRARNRDAILDKSRAYYAEKKDMFAEYKQTNRDRLLAQRREYYARNKGVLLAATSAWFNDNPHYRFNYWKANPEKCRLAGLRWRKNNPEAVRARQHRRRVRLYNAEGSHTAEDIKALYVAQAGICTYCRDTLPHDYHVDHKTPLVRGGSNSKENLQLLCPPCNHRKWTRTHEEFTELLTIRMRAAGP